MKSKKKKYHHGNLRSSFLDAALKVLEAQGLHGLSLREVAKQVGVSHTAPYRHFKDKEALVAALAQRGFEVIASYSEKAIADYPEDPRQQLFKSGTAYSLYLMKNPYLADLMFGTYIRDFSKYPSLENAAKSSFHLLESILKNCEKKGLLQEKLSYEAVVASWAQAHGVGLLAASGAIKLEKTESKDWSQAIEQIVSKSVLKNLD